NLVGDVVEVDAESHARGLVAHGVDAVDGAAQHRLVGEVADDELGRGREVLGRFLVRGEGVEDDDGVAAGGEPLADRSADESGAAGHEYAHGSAFLSVHHCTRRVAVRASATASWRASQGRGRGRAQPARSTRGMNGCQIRSVSEEDMPERSATATAARHEPTTIHMRRSRSLERATAVAGPRARANTAGLAMRKYQ